MPMLVQLLKPEFDELIQRKDWVGLKEILTDLPPADIAELLVELGGCCRSRVPIVKKIHCCGCFCRTPIKQRCYPSGIIHQATVIRGYEQPRA